MSIAFSTEIWSMFVISKLLHLRYSGTFLVWTIFRFCEETLNRICNFKKLRREWHDAKTYHHFSAYWQWERVHEHFGLTNIYFLMVILQKHFDNCSISSNLQTIWTHRQFKFLLSSRCFNIQFWLSHCFRSKRELDQVHDKARKPRQRKKGEFDFMRF